MSAAPVKIVTVIDNEGQEIGKFPLNIACANLKGCNFKILNEKLEQHSNRTVEISTGNKTCLGHDLQENHTLVWKVGEYV
jgi:hypothetical protein